MLHLYTLPPNPFIKLKAKLKKILKKNQGGPQAVFDSLVRGLNELGVSYTVNEHDLKNNPIETACVLSKPQTLCWAIREKKKGRIKKIIAGPNIVVIPKIKINFFKTHSLTNLLFIVNGLKISTPVLLHS